MTPAKIQRERIEGYIFVSKLKLQDKNSLNCERLLSFSLR